MTETAISFRHVGKRFNGRSPVTAIADLSFDIARGETLALAGPSGSGKSTIGRLVLRLIEPDAGHIAFEGEDFLALAGEAQIGVNDGEDATFGEQRE